MRSLFIPAEISRLIGISYRQLEYWDKTDFIKPSHKKRGKYRRYSFSDLVQLRLAKLLREREISIQRLRRVVRSVRAILPQIKMPLTNCTFLVEGERILVFNGEVQMNKRNMEIYLIFRVSSLVDDVNAMFPGE